ncbi:pro-resilin-like isoform X2 [Varroa destructor]|nr:pro-resilin-like isoform X2 [Varroa destructor]
MATYAAYPQPGGSEDYEDDGNFVSGSYGSGPSKPSDAHHERGEPSFGGIGNTGGASPRDGSDSRGAGPGALHGHGDYEQHHGDEVGGGENYDVAEEWRPYAFSYSAHDAEGSHLHQQQADSKNRVTGQYSIMMADGRMRVVKYIADENGFRAEIVTNEQGTESKNPADVTIQSTAPTGEEASKQFGSAGPNNRFDQRPQSPQQGGHHQTGENSGLVDTSEPGHHRGHYGDTQDFNSHSGKQAGGHGGYNQGKHDSYSDMQSYLKDNSQRYVDHDGQAGYSKGQSEFQSSGYSSQSSSEYSSQQDYSQPSPADYGGAPLSGTAGDGSGSFGNDISDFEGYSHHTDTGYYSGTGSRPSEGSKGSRQKNKASYG